MSGFYLQNNQEQWSLGIFVAFALHVLVLLLAIYGPEIFHYSQKKEQIYTVKLFEPVQQKVQRAAPAPKHAPASKPPPVKASKPLKKMPPAPKKVVSEPAKPKQSSPKVVPPKPQKSVKKVSAPKSAPKTQETVKKPAPKAVSLNPEKKKPVKKSVKPPVKTAKEKPKTKKTVQDRPASKKVSEPSQDDLLAKRLAAIKQQVREKEEEKKLAEKLAALRKKVIKEKGTGGTASRQAGRSAFSTYGQGDRVDEVIARYGMEVSQRIWRRWNLPTQLIDAKGLEAIIEIKISESGRILATRFEKSSGNMLFDRSAMRAVKDASPVPPLPPQLRPGPLVMGIRFRPEDI